MSTPARSVLVLCVAIGSFVAGSWWNRHPQTSQASSGVRRISYYHDPMHPAYRSDGPGIAPDCGMQLEPVYADGGPAGGAAGLPRPPGTVTIGGELRQLQGIAVAAVQRSATLQPLRLLGRVAPDERRVYSLNAALEG